MEHQFFKKLGQRDTSTDTMTLVYVY